MRVRSLLAKSVRRALAHYGQDVIPRTRFGYDVYLDIQRLARAWGWSVELFLDVGANNGSTTLQALIRFPNVRVVAFEPHPATFSRLTERVGNRSDVRLVNLALGAEGGERTMFVYDSSILNSLVPNAQFAVRFGKTAVPIVVPCSTVDLFCSEHSIAQIDVLKIDTEGLDFEVLSGARTMMDRGAIRFVYVEFNDIHPSSGRAGGALAPMDRLIRPYGFRFIASYNDYVVTDGELFVVSNALFARPPCDPASRD
jgi:FkbM family methyltransferase